MSKFRRKFKWKNILSFVLVGVLLVGAVAGLGSVFNKDTKTISSSAFSVGGINAQGNYEKTDLSIYTKDMFECQGLSIEPDFEATGTYKVFYYDSNKNFIGATDELNAEDGVYTKGDKFVLAQYARVMITPDVPTDEDGKEVEDFKIRFYEVTSYAGDYTITVSKEQKEMNLSENLFKNFKDNARPSADGVNQYTDHTGSSTCENIDVEDYSTVYIVGASAPTALAIYDKDGAKVEIITSANLPLVDGVVTLDMSKYEGASVLAFCYPTGTTYSVYGAK